MNSRLKTVRLIIVIILFLLVLRAGQLQLISGDYYYDLSEGNRISLRPINAPRGKIIDKNGNIIVSNNLSYNLYLLPNELPPGLQVKEVIVRLGEITDFDISSLQKKYNENKNIYNSSLLLKRNISSKNMVRIEENGEKLPGLIIKDSFMRQYLYDETGAHVMGYIGQINAEMLKKFNEAGYDYSGGDIVGMTGLEKEYERYLKGDDGIEQIEVNSMGNKIKTIGIRVPEPGNNLILNLDINLQEKVKELLLKKFYELRQEAKNDEELTSPTGASAVVLDANNGAVRAMTSIPAFDPNLFSGGIRQKDYTKLQNSLFDPLLNRNTMAAVPPGSIFKLVTGTAAIKYLNVNAETEFVDRNGKFYVPNWSKPFRNWYPIGEGRLNFTKAIARSNNIVFYKLGYRLYKEYGGEVLVKTARHYGLGEKTGIDLPNEKAGLVPDREWKKKKFGEGWYPGDSVNLSIGQGGLLTTPLQLAVMVSSIANDGIIYQPQLVDKITDSDENIVKDIESVARKKLSFDNKTYDILKEGMKEVANADYGTASSIFGDFPVKIAGKTGTAETGKSNHGWFAGFAPADNPEIVVVIFIENGNSSSNALPVAKEVFKEYFGLNKEDDKPIIDYSTIIEKYTRESNKLIDYFRSVFLKD